MDTPGLRSSKAVTDLVSGSRVNGRVGVGDAQIRESVLGVAVHVEARPVIRDWHLVSPFRTFSSTFLFTVCFTVFCYFAMVTVVNPRGVFWGRSFPEILPNSRGLKLDLLQKYNSERPVDLVVLGSSRSMKFSPELLESLTGERSFNAGVFSGGPVDYLAIYRVMKREGIVPRTVLLGLDQNSLDPDNAPAPDFNSNLTLISALKGIVPNEPARLWHRVMLYKRTLTPFYVRNVGESLWVKFHPRPALFTFEPNGHETEAVMDAQMQAGIYPRAEKIAQCENVQKEQFAQFQEASSELEGDLKQLLSEATADHVQVVLWITPVHPDALARILEEPVAGRNFRNAEAHLVKIGADYRLTVRDLTDSRSFGSQSSTWYDCVHYSQADSDKIATKLFTHGL